MLVRTLAKRSEFLAANRGLRFPVPGFVLLVRKRDDGDDQLGIGYTVSKKVGNAVTRNRMKRRMRALVRDILPENGMAGCDHVLIGRPGANDIAFADLGDQLSSALRRAAKKLEQGITVESRSYHGGRRKSNGPKGTAPNSESPQNENRHRPRAVPRIRKGKDTAVADSADPNRASTDTTASSPMTGPMKG
jgi:ribonuclease P protein component